MRCIECSSDSYEVRHQQLATPDAKTSAIAAVAAVVVVRLVGGHCSVCKPPKGVEVKQGNARQMSQSWLINVDSVHAVAIMQLW